jgi:hypothetical protein
MYCVSLLNNLDAEHRHRINESDLNSIKNSEDIRRFIHGTFSTNTTLLEQSIVCGLENKTEFTLPDVDVVLKKHGLYLSIGEIENSCESLVLSGFLSRVGGLFRFVTPLLPMFLREYYSTDLIFSKLKEDHKHRR